MDGERATVRAFGGRVRDNMCTLGWLEPGQRIGTVA